MTELVATEPAATLELLGAGDISVAPSATVTPAIKTELQKLQPGEVLLVSIDDPSARFDVPAWCALTGNVLQETSVGGDGVILFFIRKESKRR